MNGRDFLEKCRQLGVELYRTAGRIHFGGSRAGIDAVLEALQVDGDKVAGLLPPPRCRRCRHLRMQAGQDGPRLACGRGFFEPQRLRALDRLEPTPACERVAGFECSQVERRGTLFEVPRHEAIR